MNLAVSNQSYFNTKSVANKILRDFTKEHLSFDATHMQHVLVIKEFYEHPEKFKLDTAPKIPDGSPIGSGLCNYNPNY